MSRSPAPTTPEGGNRILPDIREEAARLTDAVLESGLRARLLGGLAVWLRCPSVRSGPFARSYQDMDFAIAKGASSVFKAFLTSEGYLGDPFFNGLHGDTRLYFQAPDGRWSVDVVIDELIMSHKLDLRERLGGPAPTLTLADLLLSKLQVWEINSKDLGDALCLLADHGVNEDDADKEGVSLPRLRRVLGGDWGFCHTTERNLGRLEEMWAESPLHDTPFNVAEQIATIRAAIDGAPKTMAWKMRSRVGERVRWYETPEEVGH
ncbi:MAG: hypothetical protein ACLQGJ_02020 [Candidatus Dormibacteria bacterium]